MATSASNVTSWRLPVFSGVGHFGPITSRLTPEITIESTEIGAGVNRRGIDRGVRGSSSLLLLLLGS
jgi:hypothetical protein